MFLNPWYSNLGRGGEDSAVPTSSPSVSDSGSCCPSPPAEISRQWRTLRGPADPADLAPSAALTARRLDLKTLAIDRPASTVFDVTATPPPALPPLPLRAHLDGIWTAHRDKFGRSFYCNVRTKCSSWLPPLSSWNSCHHLPYGWEMALDAADTRYFINHLNRTTTYFDPRREEEPAPEPRHVTLSRDAKLGFGFVAGSEKPVIVRFVSEGGPSADRLMPGDQLLAINGCDVKSMSRDLVIDMVHSSHEQISMVVCQPPPRSNMARKSAILSATKKLRLRSSSSRARVRFSSGIIVNGHSSLSPFSIDELQTTFVPNVLKVFLENGQTKSFKYSCSTTVQEVLESLASKLGISRVEHFGIALQQMTDGRRNRLELLDGTSTVTKIASQPGAHNLRCIFRLVFVPRDGYELLKDDPVAFEYLYVQCCADVLHERFAPELKHDVALLLAALHIHQHITSNNAQCKPTVKNVEREYGLQRFVPASLLASIKPKELRKLLAHFLKSHQLLACLEEQRQALQYKLNYLKIIAELPSYGAKCYSAAIDDENKPDSVLLVSPRFGVSRINAFDNDMPERVCCIDQLISVEMTGDDAELNCSDRISVLLMYGPSKQTMLVSLDSHSAAELVLVLCGYFRLLTGNFLPVKREDSPSEDDVAPAYHSSHRVTLDTWSYGRASSYEDVHVTVDFSLPPPDFRQRAALGRADSVDQSSTGQHSRSASDLSSHFLQDNNMNNTGKADLHISPCADSVIANSERTCSASINQTYNQQIVGAGKYTHLLADQEQHSDGEVSSPATGRKIEGADVGESAASEGADGDNDSLRSLVSRLPPGETGTRDSTLPNDGLLRLAQMSKDRLDGVDLKRQSVVLTSAEDKPIDPDQHEVCRPLPRDDSSFGLHSPSAPSESDIKWNSSNKTLDQTIAVDAELIDLTKIPPPATPDQELCFGVPSSADASHHAVKTSSPPTPFSDVRVWIGEDGDLIGQPTPSVTLLSSNGYSSGVTCVSPTGDSATSSGFDSQPAGSDIDSMIANLTLPPPPNVQQQAVCIQEDSPVVELTRDDIASFIIPPPPHSNERNKQIHQSVENGPCSLDPMAGSDEIQVPVTRCARQRVCSKIASLQQTLLHSSHNGKQNQRTAVYAVDQQLDSALEQNEVAFGLLSRSTPSTAGGHNHRDSAFRQNTGSPQLPVSSPPDSPRIEGNGCFHDGSRVSDSPHSERSDSLRGPDESLAVPALPPKRLTLSSASSVPPLPPKLNSPQSEVGAVPTRLVSARCGESAPLENMLQRVSVASPRSARLDPRGFARESSGDVLQRLQSVYRRLGAQCSGSSDPAQYSGHCDPPAVDFQQLSAACRQLVTASKLLVQAAADGRDMQAQLETCVRLTEAAADVSAGGQPGVLTRYLHETCGELLTTAQCVTADRLDVDQLTDRASRLAAALTVLLRAIKSAGNN